MKLDRRKIRGWLGIAIFAAAGLYVVSRMSGREIGFGALFILGAIPAALAFLAIWEFAPRLWRKLFPPPPLWAAPREVSALFEAEAFSALEPRLELLASHERESLWRDRETRQLWLATAFDFEFTENHVYAPVGEPPAWYVTPG